jgi:hypothetical protein
MVVVVVVVAALRRLVVVVGLMATPCVPGRTTKCLAINKLTLAGLRSSQIARI